MVTWLGWKQKGWGGWGWGGGEGDCWGRPFPAFVEQSFGSAAVANPKPWRSVQQGPPVGADRPGPGPPWKSPKHLQTTGIGIEQTHPPVKGLERVRMENPRIRKGIGVRTDFGSPEISETGNRSYVWVLLVRQFTPLLGCLWLRLAVLSLVLPLGPASHPWVSPPHRGASVADVDVCGCVGALEVIGC